MKQFAGWAALVVCAVCFLPAKPLVICALFGIAVFTVNWANNALRGGS